MKKKSSKHSDGWYHGRITIIFSPIAALIGCAAFFIPLEIWQRGVLAFIGCLAGIFITPDLDLQALSTAEVIWVKVPVVGYTMMHFWSWFWFPYASLFKHRGSSHSVLKGTLSRIVYLLIWIPVVLTVITLMSYLVLHLQGVSVGHINLETSVIAFLKFILNSVWYILCFCVGLFVSDVGHILRDNKVWKFGDSK